MTIAPGKGSININLVVKTLSVEKDYLGTNPATFLASQLSELAVLMFLHPEEERGSHSIKLLTMRFIQVYAITCFSISKAGDK